VNPDRTAVAIDVVILAGGVLLLAGLWTPIVGAIIALVQLWIAWSQYHPHSAGVSMHILMAVISGAVAMLGPGAWSADAYVFGRKRFEIGHGTPKR
jgi:uncharacterized membrane protein YphA (DoxX/SURF4 family)